MLQPTKHPAISSLENNIIHPIPVTIASHGFKQWPDHYHTDMTYGVTTTQHPAKQVEGTESNEFIWVTVKELQNIPDTEILGSIREIGLQVLTYFVKNWYEIPFSTYKTNNPSFNSHTENV